MITIAVFAFKQMNIEFLERIPNKVDFYKKDGFEKRPNNVPGMWYYQLERWNGI